MAVPVTTSNRTGFRGVYWSAEKQKYRAEIGSNRNVASNPRKREEALATFAFWFRKWPYFKPSPLYSEDLQRDLERAAPFIPDARSLSPEAPQPEAKEARE